MTDNNENNQHDGAAGSEIAEQEGVDLIESIEKEFGPIAWAEPDPDYDATQDQEDTGSDTDEGAENDTEDDAEDKASSEPQAQVERAVPRPPRSSTSRKRPCRKQGGRKQDRRDHRGHANRPKERKLNRYALDQYTGLIVSVRPGDEIPNGSRVIEQPPGNDKPTIAAFYNAALLPDGSTLNASWGRPVPELDQQLEARAGRLARLAGLGDQARSSMFDQIRGCANPTAALEALIVQVGGQEALTAAPGTITTSVDRAVLNAAVKQAVNAGNDKVLELQENLPDRLTPEKRLADILSSLAGVTVVGLEKDGNGCILRLRSMRLSDKGLVCGKLREAGGYNIDVQNTRVEKEGKQLRAFVVAARFRAAPVEIAAARTGRNAEISYSVHEDGTVHAEYVVDLYGTRITTGRMPCEPSWRSVEFLIEENARRGDRHTVELLAKLSVQFSPPAQAITQAVGPVRTLEQAREALSALRAEDFVDATWAEGVRNAARMVKAFDGRRIPVEYRGTDAVLDEFSFHPTDLRAALLPAHLAVGDEEVSTLVRRVRFEPVKDKQHLRVVVEEIGVDELAERRRTYLEGKDPEKMILTEVRENFIAEATRSMTNHLVNPSESIARAERPEAMARSRVLSRHLDPYAAEGGDLVHLVQVLADSAGDAEWSRWCRESVKAFCDDARERRKRGQEPANDFFVGAVTHADARTLLVLAGAQLLAERLGREVTLDEFVELARKARVTKEHALTAVDRGRALARYVKRHA